MSTLFRQEAVAHAQHLLEHGQPIEAAPRWLTAAPWGLVITALTVIMLAGMIQVTEHLSLRVVVSAAGRTTVRAHVDGYVDTVLARPGAHVRAGEPLFEMHREKDGVSEIVVAPFNASIGHVYLQRGARVTVGESLALLLSSQDSQMLVVTLPTRQRVRQGAMITLHLDNGHVLIGTVRSSTQSVRNGEELRVEMSARSASSPEFLKSEYVSASAKVESRRRTVLERLLGQRAS